MGINQCDLFYGNGECIGRVDLSKYIQAMLLEHDPPNDHHDRQAAEITQPVHGDFLTVNILFCCMFIVCSTVAGVVSCSRKRVQFQAEREFFCTCHGGMNSV